MDRYIVGFAFSSDNDILQFSILADSELEAMLKYLAEEEDIIFEEDEMESITTVNDLKDKCIDMGVMISAYKI